MGLLDDAIREHLELKRRRGADGAEVERQEHEALGPPVRGEFAAPADATAPAPPAEAAADPVASDEADPEPEPEPPPAVAAPPPEPDWLDEPLDPPPDATRVHAPVADEPAPPPEPASDDVLEETPDFLQETPEHDRLWFEQKPPRDFDLDK